MSDSTDHQPDRVRDAIRKTGKIAGDVAGKTAYATKKAADDGLRIGANVVENVRGRLDREPGEPNRPAVLDGDAAVSAVEGTGVDAAVAVLASQALLADYLASRHEDVTREQKMGRVLDS